MLLILWSARVLANHKAQIGKVRMAIFESYGHGGELLDVSGKLKGNVQHSVPDERQYVRARRQVNGRLRQDVSLPKTLYALNPLRLPATTTD
jgi:hypothetical protein